MRICTIVAIAGASLASDAWAVVNTRLDFQVSTDAVNWSTSIEALPGQQVYVRTLVSYTGTNAPVGLSALLFQPTVSNWASQDTLLPLVNGGWGGNNSTPVGTISGSQVTDSTSFGRLSPWGRVHPTTSQAYMGHVHENPLGDGVRYLRIATAVSTSWFGGAGNTTGGQGIHIGQLNDLGRMPGDAAFNPSLQDIYALKLGIVLDPTAKMRTMWVTTPAEWMGNRSVGGERQVHWFMNMTEPTGSERGTAIVNGAAIHVVPSPGTLVGMGGVAVLAFRRRRTHS